ncbi:hypothetical protein [Merdimmobilis hominis]|uniref:hypothetical protein n=1 Tax=Merdimmobilis hominis TaxID=2897707 RepID=UPI00189A9E55|nr:hypothetical protein [Merdimmobilis hominis]
MQATLQIKRQFSRKIGDFVKLTDICHLKVGIFYDTIIAKAMIVEEISVRAKPFLPQSGIEIFSSPRGPGNYPPQRR